MSEGRQAARGVVALAGLQTLGRVLGFAFLLVATRALMPTQLARYSIVAAIVAVGGALADFGTTPAITRRVSANPASADELLARTLLACTALGLVAYLAALGFALAAGYPSVTLVDLLIGGLALPGDAALTSILAALDGSGLISRRAAISFLRVAVMTAAPALLIGAGFGVRTAMFALAAAPAVAIVPAVTVARRTRVWMGGLRPNCGAVLGFSRPCFPSFCQRFQALNSTE